MGAALAARAGFEERELVRVKRGRVHGPTGEPNAGDVELWVAVRPPLGPSASDESATSSSSDSQPHLPVMQDW